MSTIIVVILIRRALRIDVLIPVLPRPVILRILLIPVLPRPVILRILLIPVLPRPVVLRILLRPVALRPIILEPVVLVLDALLDLVDELADFAIILAHELCVDGFRALHGWHSAIDKPVGHSWLSRSW